MITLHYIMRKVKLFERNKKHCFYPFHEVYLPTTEY